MTEFSALAQPPQTRRRWPRVILALLAILGLAIAGLYAYLHFGYANRALPGTHISGLDVSGQSIQDVENNLRQQFSTLQITVSSEAGEKTIPITDTGVKIDEKASAEQLSGKAAGFMRTLLSPFQTKEFTPRVIVDDGQLQRFAEDLYGGRDAVKNARLEINPRQLEFKVVPGVNGKGVDLKSLKQPLLQHATQLQGGKIEANLVELKPNITDEMAQQAAKKAEALTKETFKLKLPESDKGWAAEPETIAAWLRVKTGENELNLDTDPESIANWVKEVSEKALITPENGLRNVDPSGKVVATPKEPRDGRNVKNADAIATELQSAVAALKPYTGTFETEKVKAGWDERKVVANYAELAYPASPGEKWMEINLTDHTTTAWIGGEKVMGPVKMVHGSGEAPTVEGLYSVYLKYEKQDMRGPNADGSSYFVKDVPWVSYWHRGYAFHGSPWNKEYGFGGSERGSHGCINLPVDTAKWVYDFAPIGTPVVSHK